MQAALQATVLVTDAIIQVYRGCDRHTSSSAFAFVNLIGSLSSTLQVGLSMTDNPARILVVLVDGQA